MPSRMSATFPDADAGRGRVVDPPAFLTTLDQLPAHTPVSQSMQCFADCKPAGYVPPLAGRPTPRQRPAETW